MTLDFTMRPEWEELRARARDVAEEGVARFGRWHDSWINGYSKDFAKVLASEGWIGMTWPTEVGGGGRPGIERIIMAEEMISAGAPIAASWVADRQMGPSIYTYGTDDQKAEFLPGILSGEATWCIGMSEPDAGSDLAALKTSAIRDGDRLRIERPEDLDVGRRIGRVLLPDLSHRCLRPTPQGRQRADRAHGSSGHRGPHRARHGGQRPLLRGLLH